MIFSISAKITSYISLKSPVFVFFQPKIAILIQKSLPLHTQYKVKNKNSDLWASTQSRFLFCLCAAILS